MSTSCVYRTRAEDCLRIARTAQDERDKPFWLDLAMSWLELAEHSARSASAFDYGQGASARPSRLPLISENLGT
jgi:hypothetical protein